MAIHFHTMDVDYALRHKNALKRWIKDCVLAENRTIKSVQVIFCSDGYLLEINRQFLQHDDYTDIITFDYGTKASISGDIFISLERVFDNASQFQQRTEVELYRVVIHGFMHLCGYKDKSKSDEKTMRAKEDACLKKLSKYI